METENPLTVKLVNRTFSEVGLASLNSFQERRLTGHAKQFITVFNIVFIVIDTYLTFFKAHETMVPSRVYMNRDNKKFMEHIIGARPYGIPQLNKNSLRIIL